MIFLIQSIVGELTFLNNASLTDYGSCLLTKHVLSRFFPSWLLHELFHEFYLHFRSNAESNNLSAYICCMYKEFGQVG